MNKEDSRPILRIDIDATNILMLAGHAYEVLVKASQYEQARMLKQDLFSGVTENKQALDWITCYVLIEDCKGRVPQTCMLCGNCCGTTRINLGDGAGFRPLCDTCADLPAREIEQRFETMTEKLPEERV